MLNNGRHTVNVGQGTLDVRRRTGTPYMGRWTGDARQMWMNIDGFPSQTDRGIEDLVEAWGEMNGLLTGKSFFGLARKDDDGEALLLL